jgi:hypothetical protein
VILAIIGGMFPPPPRAAILAAAIRSRCPVYSQYGQLKTRPLGLFTLRSHDGHVDDVPRSSISRTMIPATWALSDNVPMRRPTRQSRMRWLCRRPADTFSTPRGSPTARTPILLLTAQPITFPAASSWDCRTRRVCRAWAARCRSRWARHRREPRRRDPGCALTSGLGARRAPALLRALTSRKCWKHSARIARPDTGSGSSPARRRLAAANHASLKRRSTERAPTLSSSPKVPGPAAASSRQCLYVVLLSEFYASAEVSVSGRR